MGVIRAIGYGVAWNTASVLIGKVLILANIFLIFSTLSVYEYGLTELTMSVYLVASIIFLPSIVSTITTDMAVEKARGNTQRIKAIFWGDMRVALFFSIAAWATFFFGSSIVAHHTGNDLIDAFVKIVAFLFFTAPLRTASTALAIVAVRFADIALIPLVEEVFKFSLLLLFFVGLDFGATGLLYAIVISQIATVAVFLPRTISAYRSFGHESAGKIETPWELLMGHRKWSLASSTLSSISQNMYVWLVKIFLGTEAVGLYSAASGIVANIAGLLPMGSVLNSFAPKYVERTNDLVRLVRSSMKVQFFIALVLIGAGYAFGPIFAYLFPAYREAIPLFYLLLIGLLPNAVMVTLTPIFAIYKEQRSLLYSSIFKFSITIVVAPIAFTTLGLSGIALENFIKNSLSLIERLIRLRRFTPRIVFHLKDFFVLDPLELSLARTLLRRVKDGFSPSVK